MTKTSVLIIGMDPKYVDPVEIPGFTPEIVDAYIRQQIGRVGEMGFEVVECLMSPDDAGENMVEAALAAKDFDCVLIGAGLREPAPLLLVFEKVLNAVHAHAPHAKICFNTSPADTAEAVQRWVAP